VVEVEQPYAIELKHNRMVLAVRPGTDDAQREAIVERWYRDQIRVVVPALLEAWQPRIGVETAGYFVQRMRRNGAAATPTLAQYV
jgi:predicted metal-dependent hydrolase